MCAICVVVLFDVLLCSAFYGGYLSARGTVLIFVEMHAPQILTVLMSFGDCILIFSL